MNKLMTALGLAALLGTAACSDSDQLQYAAPSPGKKFDVTYSKISRAGLSGDVDDCVRIVKHKQYPSGECDVMGRGFRVDAITWKTHEEVSLTINGGKITHVNKAHEKKIGDVVVGIEVLHNNEPI